MNKLIRLLIPTVAAAVLASACENQQAQTDASGQEARTAGQPAKAP